MPRHKEAKKDAANGETRRRAVSRQGPVDVRMGEPGIHEGGIAQARQYAGNWNISVPAGEESKERFRK